jgi:hypothetical protein
VGRNDSADAAIDAFGDSIKAFTEEMKTNDTLRGILQAGEGGFRKLRHYGNPETWDWTTPELRRAIQSNTGHHKHAYDSYRDYFWSKPGQEDPETAKLSGEQKKALLPSLGARGITRYDQSVQRRQIEGGIQEGPLDIYAVESQQRGRGFFEGLSETRRTHKFGAAVELKDQTVVNQQKWYGSGSERITAMESRR